VLDPARQGAVVDDIEQRWRLWYHVAARGSSITRKKSPSPALSLSNGQLGAAAPFLNGMIAFLTPDGRCLSMVISVVMLVPTDRRGYCEHIAVAKFGIDRRGSTQPGTSRAQLRNAPCLVQVGPGFPLGQVKKFAENVPDS
jgi:hypothetical protein